MSKPMKHIITACLMLVLMGQRWESTGEWAWISPICTPSSWGTIICIDPSNYYRLVYVIGEKVRLEGTNWTDNIELFTIPVPNTPTKAMSKEDADKINGDLRKAWR